MKDYFIAFKTVLAIICTLQLAISAYAATDGPTGLECSTEQSIWVYEFGDRGEIIAPVRDGGVSNAKFEVWQSDGKDYFIANLSGLPSQITEASSLERFLVQPVEEGESAASVLLGDFYIETPLGDYTQNGTIEPRATTRNRLNDGVVIYPILVSNLIDQPAYNGELTYKTISDSGLEYMRLALCSGEPTSPPIEDGINPSEGGIKKLEAELRSQKSKNEVLNAANSRLTTDNARLTRAIGNFDVEKRVLNNQLDDLQGEFEVLEGKKLRLNEIIKGIQVENETLKASIQPLKDEIGTLKSKLSPWKFATGILGLLSFGLGGLLVFRPKGRVGKTELALPRYNSSHRERPSKPLERPENTSVVFPSSSMQAGNVATPLSPAGQLTASNLQMLTGQYATLLPAYHATGRIGYAQEGKPTSEDYSFGTGFLITPNHVMTNRHVHGFYGHYLTSPEDCGGIEFIAEKDKDASDFIPFNGQPPLLVLGLDIAIYTLSRSAGNRIPISRVTIPTEDLEGREIVVVGYPDTHEPNDPNILAVVEDDPIFAVKRISQGTIFRHSSDDDDPYGVEVEVAINDSERFPMTAICHNASTLGGNSGSPILDLKTGELLGVHFAGHKVFNQKEAANLAMAIAQLTEHSDIQNI